ncbi:MFS transporter [Corynebacterium pelargi]|nr:MFS transporter [Corynebacterium pelargi]
MTQRNAEYPSMPLPERQAWPALIALCVGFFMILLDQTIVAVATPVLQDSLHASYNEVIWVTSAYLLTFAVPLLITGRLGDKFGPKNVYILGMAIFTLSSLACGFAPNMTTLIIARAVQGLGASLLTPQTMSVINRIFARNRRGAALGVWGTTAGLATLAGPTLGGLITSTIGWQWIFFINVPLGVVSVLAVAKWVPRFRPIERSIDGLSMLLSVVAVASVIVALQEGEREQWGWPIWVLLAFGFLTAYAFVRQQARAEAASKEPLAPLELFGFRNFSLGNIGIAVMGFAVAGTPLPVMLYLQQVHEYSALKAGLFMVPQALISAVLSPFVGRLADRVSPGRLAALGFSVLSLSFFLLGFAMTLGLAGGWFLGIMVIQGLGNSVIWAPNSTSTMRDLPHALMGAGSGVYNTTRQVGSVVGSAAVGAVLQWRVSVTDMGTAYGQAIILAAAVLIIGAISSAAAKD